MISAENSARAWSARTWILHFSRWLTPRRLRTQTIVLGVCTWAIFLIDFSAPGQFDRAGNIKFQDFLSFYGAAHLVHQGRAASLYDPSFLKREMLAIIPQPQLVNLPYVYGPQVALLFSPLTRFSFFTAAWVWTGVSLFLYFASICMVLEGCTHLHLWRNTIFLAAAAFPALFHVIVRGQISVLPLLCFTFAWFALRARHDFLAGIALGFLILKPSFLVAIPLLLLLAEAWSVLLGAILSAAAQLALAWAIFGTAVMHNYFDILRYTSSYTKAVEPGSLAPIQMHSLRAFWSLLIPQAQTPWAQIAFVLYFASSIAIIVLAAAAWRSSTSSSLRFAVLTLVAVLANPHLFVYDLLVLAPALLLLSDAVSISGSITDSAHRDWIRCLLYLAFVLPLLGPLSRWTHLQLSVITFTALLWILWRVSRKQSVPALSS